ncbi:MAG: agmatine deiminase family protein [Phycisphaerae bacterium]
MPERKLVDRRTCVSVTATSFGLSASIERLEPRRLLSGDKLDLMQYEAAWEGALPRFRTDAELANPATKSVASVPSTPPSGLIDSVAEWEEMEALNIAWADGMPTAWLNNLAEITRYVTVEGGGRMYITVEGSNRIQSVQSRLNSFGADLSKVTYHIAPLNALWVRDYGPRYIYESDVRVVTDHRYYPSRPLDDRQPISFTNLKQHEYYEMGIGTTMFNHGGGNYHLDNDGDAWATSLVTNFENPTLSIPQVQEIWRTYQGNETTITGQYPFSVDGTGHIDMWMQIWGERKAFVADWPNNPGSTQDVISDNTAAAMAARGYEVTRLPNYLIGGVHYTFANMVVFNDIILLPQYNNGPGAGISNQVFNIVKDAVGPDMQVFQINADSLVTASGVFHCIVQHIPVHRGQPGPNGGLAPTAFVRDPQSPLALLAGQTHTIEWITDDDGPTGAQGVQGVDILLSIDGGETFDTVIASNQPALGSLNWTVPAGIDTTLAMIRVVAEDADGNTGFDDLAELFTIGNPSDRPTEPLLAAVSDTGLSASDGITRLNNSSPQAALSFLVDDVTPGATVQILADGVAIGTAVAAGTSVNVTTDGLTPLADGLRVITARQMAPGKAFSSPSPVSSILVDSVSPSIVSSDFVFDAEQRLDLAFSEPATPTGLLLVNLTTGEKREVLDVTLAPDAASGSLDVGDLLADGNWQLTLSQLTDVAGNTLATPFSDDFFVLAGDADRDRFVNLADFNLLAANFGRTDAPGFTKGDFNYDGVVNLADFNILAANFGAELPALLRQTTFATAGRADLAPAAGGTALVGSREAVVTSADRDRDRNIRRGVLRG